MRNGWYVRIYTCHCTPLFLSHLFSCPNRREKATWSTVKNLVNRKCLYTLSEREKEKKKKELSQLLNDTYGFNYPSSHTSVNNTGGRVIHYRMYTHPLSLSTWIVCSLSHFLSIGDVSKSTQLLLWDEIRMSDMIDSERDNDQTNNLISDQSFDAR